MRIRQYELNKLYKDKFGIPSGILALNKPTGITSHDLVDRVRVKLKTRRVGHAGTLDPFASGLMIILIGNTTKLSNQLLFEDKEYLFDVLLGIATDTQDPEGRITSQMGIAKMFKNTLIQQVLNSFLTNYSQRIPLYSSISINGIRLRELARSSSKFTVKDTSVTFSLKADSFVYKKLFRQKKLKGEKFTIELPTRDTAIYSIELLGSKMVSGDQIKLQQEKVNPQDKYQLLNIRAKVSKGTYIRQLATDIGERLGEIPAMLYKLERTKIGDLSLNDTIELEQIC